MGGWITMVQYCSSGFRPWPTPCTMLPRPASRMEKGLSTNAINIRKKVSVTINTDVTQGIMSRNLRRFMKTTTAEYVESSHDHNSKEPCCPPHHAVNL